MCWFKLFLSLLFSNCPILIINTTRLTNTTTAVKQTYSRRSVYGPSFCSYELVGEIFLNKLQTHLSSILQNLIETNLSCLTIMIFVVVIYRGFGQNTGDSQPQHYKFVVFPKFNTIKVFNTIPPLAMVSPSGGSDSRLQLILWPIGQCLTIMHGYEISYYIYIIYGLIIVIVIG